MTSDHGFTEKNDEKPGYNDLFQTVEPRNLKLGIQHLLGVGQNLIDSPLTISEFEVTVVTKVIRLFPDIFSISLSASV